MSTKLNLVINDCGTDLDCALGGAPTLVYSGSIAGMGTGIALGTFNGGQGHRYEFIPTLDTQRGRTTTRRQVRRSSSSGTPP